MARNSISYLCYLDKLVDEYNNTFHRSICKKRIDADYSALTEEIKTIPKAPKFKVSDRVRITKSKARVAPEIGQEIYLLLIPC